MVTKIRGQVEKSFIIPVVPYLRPPMCNNVPYVQHFLETLGVAHWVQPVYIFMHDISVDGQVCLVKNFGLKNVL